MNERIKEFAIQAEFSENELHIQGDNFQRFAELIVKECIDQCSQEWYELNNSSKEELDDRGIAIRLGQKAGVLKAQGRIKKHFGVE